MNAIIPRRVVVTGVGVFCAIGNTASEFAASLRAGRSGIGEATRFEGTSVLNRTGAEIKGYVPTDRFDSNQLLLQDLSTQYAMIAAAEAIGQSGVEFGPMKQRAGVIVGSGAGAMASIELNFRGLFDGSGKKAHPFTVPRIMMNAPAGHLSMTHKIAGPSFVVSSACSSSAHAISIAEQMIRFGLVDAVLVGGTEACMTEGTFRAWEALRVMSPDLCTPFAKGRKGLVIGEGAAMFVLEARDSAIARGALPIGELMGSAMNSDASHLLTPAVEGQIAVMQECLSNARLSAGDVHYINAHGTGTTANDLTETRALRTVFGVHAEAVPVSSTKSMHGHTLGAAGAIEAAATLIALNGGFLPPTLHLHTPDPECDLDYVPNHARDVDAEIGLSNSFAFGGHNVSLALGSQRIAAAVSR